MAAVGCTNSRPRPRRCSLADVVFVESSRTRRQSLLGEQKQHRNGTSRPPLYKDAAAGGQTVQAAAVPGFCSHVENSTEAAEAVSVAHTPQSWRMFLASVAATLTAR